MHFYYTADSCCTVFSNFVFSPFALFVQLHRCINIHTSTSSPLLITQHYMFRPNWQSSGAKDIGLKQRAALLSRCSAFHFDAKCI
jgi:hypothetical protein